MRASLYSTEDTTKNNNAFEIAGEKINFPQTCTEKHQHLICKTLYLHVCPLSSPAKHPGGGLNGSM
jgi:hypothetical protein